MKIYKSILVQLAVLVALAPLVLSVGPITGRPVTIPEDEVLPDVEYAPFDPKHKSAVAWLEPNSAKDGEFVLPKLGTPLPMSGAGAPVQPQEPPIGASTGAGIRASPAAKTVNQDYWWQRWTSPWSTGARVAPDNSMKATQPNRAALSASAEVGARTSTTIVKNTVSPQSWLPSFRFPWSAAREAAPISSTDQLSQGVRKTANTGTYWSRFFKSAGGAIGRARSSLLQYLHGA